MNFLRLFIRQKALELSQICMGNDFHIAEIPFPLCGFFRQNMTCKCIVALPFSAACFIKSFGGSAICFHFWHRFIPCILFILQRSDDHNHLPALHLWHTFDLAKVFNLSSHGLKLFQSTFLVGHFPAAKPKT